MHLLSALGRFGPFTRRETPAEGTGLLAGRDGWLFWVARHRANLQHWRATPKTNRRVAGWTRLFEARTAALAARGIPYRVAIIPDKLSIYHPKLVNDEGIDPALAIGRRVNGNLIRDGFAETVIDLFAPLEAARDAADLYLRTDTHFTPAGYRLAYARLCAALGASPAPHVLAAPLSREAQVTDLGSKLVPPATEMADRLAFEPVAVRTFVNGLASFRESQTRDIPGVRVGSAVAFRNDAPEIDPRRIAVFGDSFTFAPAGLGPMLAESFREVHLFWSTRLDHDLIRQIAPDVVLTLTAEFFLGPVPSDSGFSLAAMAEARLAAAREGRALPT